MSDRIARWWTARLHASWREPRLAGAVLDRRFAAYAIQRLRGFAIARGAGMALYVVEASVLLRALPARGAIVALLAAHASALVTGAWWGATELQRSAIRDDPDAAERTTAEWLWWALRLAVVAFAVAIVAAVRVRASPVASAYALVLGLRIAADLPLRVWHARISARQRIYRAMSLQVAIEVIGPAIVLAAHARLGAWGFFAAMGTSAIASRTFAWAFIRAAHRNGRVPWARPARARPSLPWRHLAVAALGGVASRVPNLAGAVFLVTPGLPGIVAVAFNLTIGALAAAGGWAWSHYVDFVALADPIYARARRRLERLVVAEAVVVGVVVGAAALAIIYWFAPRTFEIDEPGVVVLIPPTFPSPVPYALAIPALALGASLLAAGQVIAWTRGAVGAVIASGAIAGIGLRYAGAIAGWVAPTARGEASAGAVRGEHLAVGLVLATIGVALAFAARRVRTPRMTRIAWDVARRRAETAPEHVIVFALARVAGVAPAFEVKLARAGAAWWARRGRSWLVAELPGPAAAALALECGGLVTAVAAGYREPTSATVARAGERHVRFRFDRAIARHHELSEHELDRIWRALRRRFDGVAPTRDVAIQEVELDGDTAIAFSARLRDASDHVVADFRRTPDADSDPRV